MLEKHYHHGDLRNALIETGIELVNREGVHRFSLRRVAAKCGVSHTAPYAHFKDIDSFLHAMGEYVSNQFVMTLHDVIEGQDNGEDIVTRLGKAYIAFFMENPNYYQFLFGHAGVIINLDDDGSINYPPFALFRDIAYQAFQKIGLPPELQKLLLINKWAVVHGIAALATNSNIQYSGDWRTLLDERLYGEYMRKLIPKKAGIDA